MKPHGWSEITWWIWGIWSKVRQNIGSMYNSCGNLWSIIIHQINLWKIHFVFLHKTRDINICEKSVYLPSREFTPMFNVRRIEVMEGQSFCCNETANWLTPNSSVKTARYFFFNNPLATSQFRKHLILSNSHMNIQKQNQIFMIYESNKSIYSTMQDPNLRPASGFTISPSSFGKSIRVQIFAEIPDRSFTLFVPMIEEPVFFRHGSNS